MNNTKRILYVLDIFPTVSETFILNEIRELEKRGYEIVILARRKEDGLQHGIVDAVKATIVYLPQAKELGIWNIISSHCLVLLNHPVNYIITFFFALDKKEKGLFWFFKNACVYARMARRYRFSRIHSHFASVASCYAMLLAKLLNKPFTFTIHGWYDLYEQPPLDLQERAEAAEMVLTISNYNKRYLTEKFAIRSYKIKVLYSGIDVDYFSTNHTAAPEEQEQLILSVARLHPVKNLELLIKACALLNREEIRYSCLIIGEGEQRTYLQGLIQENHLEDSVHLAGAKPLEEVREYYKKASVFVLPSRHETMGVTTMEAMASGLPVISSRIYGIPELIDDTVTGYLIQPDDVEQLAGYLKLLLSDAVLRRTMGKAGREKIERNFNLRTQIDKLMRVWGHA